MSGKPLFFAVILLIIVGLSDQADEESLPNRPPVVVGKKTYYVETFLKANWYRASQFCRYHGMHLASVTSEEEHIKLVDEFIAIGNITGYWTSGNDLAKSQSFVWSSTGESFTYKNWQKNEPDNTVWAMDGVEHCVEMDNTNEEDTEQPQSSTSSMDSSSSTTTTREKSETTETGSSSSETTESTTEIPSNGTSKETTTTDAPTTQTTAKKDTNTGKVKNRVHIFVSKKSKNNKIDNASQSQTENHNNDVTNDGNTTTTEPPSTTAPTENPDTDVTTTEPPSTTEPTTEDNQNIPDIRKKNMYKWKDSLCTQTRYFVCEIQNK